MAGAQLLGHRGLQGGCRLGALVGSRHSHAAPGKRRRRRRSCAVPLKAVMGQRVKAASHPLSSKAGIDSDSGSTWDGIKAPNSCCWPWGQLVATDMSSVQVPPPLSRQGHRPMGRVLHQPLSRIGGSLLQSLVSTWGCRCQPRASLPCSCGFPSPSRSPIGEPNLIQIKTKGIRRGLLPAWEMPPPNQRRALSSSAVQEGPPSTHPQGGFRQSRLPSQFCPGSCFRVLASLESWKRE